MSWFNKRGKKFSKPGGGGKGEMRGGEGGGGVIELLVC